MKYLGFVCLIAMAQLSMAADDEATARKNLTGVWAGGVENGAQGHVLTIKTDIVTCVRKRGDKVTDIGGGTVKLDLSKKPWKMDGTGTLGKQQGRSYFGIYSLKGDTLRWCVNSKQPPSEFKTGNGNFFLVLKRQKSN